MNYKKITHQPGLTSRLTMHNIKLIRLHGQTGRQTITKNVPMKFTPENVYHIYNQGNNKEQVFKEDVHYYYFLQLY